MCEVKRSDGMNHQSRPFSGTNLVLRTGISLGAAAVTKERENVGRDGEVEGV